MIDEDQLVAGEQNTTPLQSVDGTALCLSGGGFRATLFCLGSLWRLNEFGALRKIRLITSVSGGSIVSAYLALKWNSLAFDTDDRATNFEEVIAKPIQDFCRRRIAIPAALGGLLNPFKSIGDEMSEAFEDLYGKTLLRELPVEGPEFLLYATSLQSGRSVRMARTAVVDYLVGMLPDPDIQLSRAVAASSAFPPVLSPQEIKTDPSRWKSTKYSVLTDDAWREKLVLTDGGVYDNMGLEAAWRRFRKVLVCDAGAPFKYDTSPHEDWLRQSMRIMDVMTDQCRALRKRWLIEDFKQGARGGAYWGIRTRIGDYRSDQVAPLVKDSDLTATLAGIRTNLDPFSPAEQGHLINWGYVLADAAICRWAPEQANGAAGKQPAGDFPLPLNEG